MKVFGFSERCWVGNVFLYTCAVTYLPCQSVNHSDEIFGKMREKG